jgi:thiol-disulfide isomerase/thioredoxin
LKLGVTLALFGFAAALGAQEPSPAPAGNNPVKSPGNAVWADTPNEARAAAASAGKLVFVEFDGGPSCGHCQRMDILLYPAFQFEALLIPMVPVKVLLDSPEGTELARRYEVKTAPAVLVVTPEGRLVFLMEGFTSAPEFYRRIQADLTSYRQFARRVEAQDIGSLPAREALATGIELYQRSDPGSALPRLKRAVSAPDATAVERDEAREQLAAVQLELKQVAESRRTTDALLKTTRDPKRRERAEIFRAQLPLHEGRPAEAIRLLQKFVADHPKSEYAESVKLLIQQLASVPASS